MNKTTGLIILISVWVISTTSLVFTGKLTVQIDAWKKVVPLVESKIVCARCFTYQTKFQIQPNTFPTEIDYSHQVKFDEDLHTYLYYKEEAECHSQAVYEGFTGKLDKVVMDMHHPSKHSLTESQPAVYAKKLDKHTYTFDFQVTVSEISSTNSKLYVSVDLGEPETDKKAARTWENDIFGSQCPYHKGVYATPLSKLKPKEMLYTAYPESTIQPTISLQEVGRSIVSV